MTDPDVFPNFRELFQRVAELWDPEWEFQSTTPSTLKDWLAVATRGLCEDARMRVDNEVMAHYLGSYEQVLSEGLCEEAARAWALTALGKAVKARRRFRKLYLTSTEFDILNAVARPRRLRYKFIATLFVLTCIYLYMPANASSVTGVWDELGGAGALLFFLLNLAFPVLFGRRVPRVVLAAQLLLLPPAMFCTVTNVIRKVIEDVTEGGWISVFGMDVPAWKVVAGLIFLATCPAVFLWISACWSTIRKFAHKHNREAAEL